MIGLEYERSLPCKLLSSYLVNISGPMVDNLVDTSYRVVLDHPTDRSSLSANHKDLMQKHNVTHRAVMSEEGASKGLAVQEP